MPRTQGDTGRARHMAYNAQGEMCMTVVDPVTRKLLIPLRYIYDTCAQQRSTLPSLCQLFLNNRCRQGANCFQVHASLEAVQALRAQVDCLPCCCVDHGDKDRAGVLLNPHEYSQLCGGTHSGDRCLRDVVLYVPNCDAGPEHGYFALSRISFTAGLRYLLEEQDPLCNPNAPVVTLTPPLMYDDNCSNTPHSTPITHPLEETKAVIDASEATICRLHAMDRCRYAEECKFLHLCKEITRANPHLTGDQGGAHLATADTEKSGVSRGTTATAAPIRKSATTSSGSHHSIFTAISRKQQQRQQRHVAGMVTPQQAFCGSASLPASLGMLSSGMSASGTMLRSPSLPTALVVNQQQRRRQQQQQGYVPGFNASTATMNSTMNTSTNAFSSSFSNAIPVASNTSLPTSFPQETQQQQQQQQPSPSSPSYGSIMPSQQGRPLLVPQCNDVPVLVTPMQESPSNGSISWSTSRNVPPGSSPNTPSLSAGAAALTMSGSGGRVCVHISRTNTTAIRRISQKERVSTPAYHSASSRSLGYQSTNMTPQSTLNATQFQSFPLASYSLPETLMRRKEYPQYPQQQQQQRSLHFDTLEQECSDNDSFALLPLPEDAQLFSVSSVIPISSNSLNNSLVHHPQLGQSTAEYGTSIGGAGDSINRASLSTPAKKSVTRWRHNPYSCGGEPCVKGA